MHICIYMCVHIYIYSFKNIFPWWFIIGFFFLIFNVVLNSGCTRNRSGQPWAEFGPQAIVCQILKKSAKCLLPSCPGHIYHKVKESSKVVLRCRNQILPSPFFSLFILRMNEQNRVTLIKNVWSLKISNSHSEWAWGFHLKHGEFMNVSLWHGLLDYNWQKKQ